MRHKFSHNELSTTELRHRARQGDAVAQLGLAERHTHGYRAFKDEQEAKRLFKLIAGHNQEYLQVAVYWLGTGANQEGRELLTKFEALAKDGHAAAQSLVARIYSDLALSDPKYATAAKQWNDQSERSARRNLRPSKMRLASLKP